MRIVEANARFLRAQLRDAVYTGFCMANYLKGARPDSVCRGRLKFDGRSFAMDLGLFNKMGINPNFFDGQLRVIVLSDAQYKQYSQRVSGGMYPFPPDHHRTIGVDVKDFGQRVADSKKIVVPEGASLGVLLHETLHYIFHNLLSAQDKDDFIRIAAASFAAANQTRGLKGISRLPERMLFCFVAEHARISKQGIANGYELERLKATDPKKGLYDLLDERNRGFFDELFSMAGEVYFGFSHPFPNGRVPIELQEFFGRLAIRRA